MLPGSLMTRTHLRSIKAWRLRVSFDSAGGSAQFFTSSDPVELYFRGVFGCVICPLIWIVVPLLRVIYGNITLHFLVKGATKR